MATDQNIVSSTEYKQVEPRLLQFKNYKFLYGPTSINITEDSRVAEYRYLFTDGAEFSKVRGVVKITIEGILIAGPVPGVTSKEKESESFTIVQKLKKLADNTFGVLITPGLGRIEHAFLTSWDFTEEGEYAKEVRFRLEFTETKLVEGIARVNPNAIKKQADVPDTQKANIEYTVVRGDTLGKIAARFGVTLGALKALNPGLFDKKHKNGNLIFPGEKIIIQKGEAKSQTPLPPIGSKSRGGSGTSTGSKLSKVKSTNDIERNARVSTFLDNKSDTLRKVGKVVAQLALNVIGFPTQTVNVVSKQQEFYRCLTPGDTVNISDTINPKALGDFVRKTTSTLDKWIDEKNKRGSVITKTVKDTLFPAFQGIISYPKDRKIYVDTIARTKINEARNLIG